MVGFTGAGRAGANQDWVGWFGRLACAHVLDIGKQITNRFIGNGTCIGGFGIKHDFSKTLLTSQALYDRLDGSVISYDCDGMADSLQQCSTSSNFDSCVTSESG